MNLFISRIIFASALVFASAISAIAQDPVPAKQLFGKVDLPNRSEAESIGFYAKGCISGAVALPVSGPNWQVLHLSRNRRWGNPLMISLLERLSRDGARKDGWPGLLVGDISQPRGGPMLNGHASHQIGLDADIWLTPMPNRQLSYEERERFPENSMLKPNSLFADPNKLTQQHMNIIMRAASYPEIERIFVHPGIKRRLCEAWHGNRELLSKVRPMYGHFYHFHVRMRCPPGQAGCVPQAEPPQNDGCGKELAYWFSDKPWKKPVPVKPLVKPVKPAKPRYLTLASLPKACTVVLNSPGVSSAAVAEYRSGGQQPSDDDASIALSQSAFTAEKPAPAAFADVGDFSQLVPSGPVPLPLERPATN